MIRGGAGHFDSENRKQGTIRCLVEIGLSLIDYCGCKELVLREEFGEKSVERFWFVGVEVMHQVLHPRVGYKLFMVSFQLFVQLFVFFFAPVLQRLANFLVVFPVHGRAPFTTNIVVNGARPCTGKTTRQLAMR